jgi:hypothetical protein
MTLAGSQSGKFGTDARGGSGDQGKGFFEDHGE